MDKATEDEITRWAEGRTIAQGYYVKDDGTRTTDPRDLIRKSPHQPSVSANAQVADAIFECTSGLIDRRLQPILERLAELEKREQKSLADAFQGPWLPQRTYKRGSLVQHDGSAWLALADVNGKPGESGEGWRMLVRGAR
jgi:hypothetical protein